eukprot:scaffold7215_cov366-Prasinococcus_capsulatus_cf.AAC.2
MPVPAYFMKGQKRRSKPQFGQGDTCFVLKPPLIACFNGDVYPCAHRSSHNPSQAASKKLSGLTDTLPQIL